VQLPFDSIGISDILQYRDCPQRFAFGMRRHVPLPERFATFEGEKDDPPEATDANNAYGSCIHDCIAIVEKEQVSDEEAITRAWPTYQHWLDPEDLASLYEDLELYHQRTHVGWRLVAAEADMKVPLFVYKGVQIYFRFKLDALYQHLQNPSIFLSRDYKSSKWPKSEEQALKDLQQWSYNWGIHEYFPECVKLTQEYDQLRAGVWPLTKTAEQRAQIKNWLIKQVTAILNDETLAPHLNQWCPWCPIIMDCTAVHRSADYWKARIEAEAPAEKQGRKVVLKLSSDDNGGFAHYAELLPKVKLARATLEKFEETVTEVLRRMSDERLTELGFKKTTRGATQFPAAVLREIHAELGDEFYQIAGLSKTRVERHFGSGKKADRAEERDAVLARGVPAKGATVISQIGDRSA
jgi:hypothetical protein